MKILFLHGLGSGENSRTAQILREAGYEVFAPELPLSPIAAVSYIWETYTKYSPDLVVGNSLGGFYTLFLCNVPKLVINPVFNAPSDISKGIGLGEHDFVKPRKSGRTKYTIDEEFINKLSYLYNLLQNYILNDRENEEQTYGLFGINDTIVNNHDLFTKFYGGKNAKYIPSSHRLEEKEVKEYVLPLIEEIKNTYGIN